MTVNLRHSNPFESSVYFSISLLINDPVAEIVEDRNAIFRFRYSYNWYSPHIVSYRPIGVWNRTIAITKTIFELWWCDETISYHSISYLVTASCTPTFRGLTERGLRGRSSWWNGVYVDCQYVLLEIEKSFAWWVQCTHIPTLIFSNLVIWDHVIILSYSIIL